MVVVVGPLLALSAITCDPADPAKCVCDGKPIGPHTWTPPSWLVSPHKSIYNTSAMYKGSTVPLSQFKAKATLVVNVASA